MNGVNIAMKLLNHKFELKPFQIESLQNLLDNKDTFCLSPTGSGKSIIYELAPLLFDFKNKGNIDMENLYSNVVIIQPLKALMEENVSHLK